MRSNFSSSHSSNLYSPGLYSPSTSSRVTSTSVTRFDPPSLPSSVTFREPFVRESSLSLRESRDSYSSRDSSLRDSTFSRFSSRRSSLTQEERRSHQDSGSTRVKRDDETSSLLERYGTRKASVGESSNQGYLKQRGKQSEPSYGLTSRRKSSDSYGAGRESLFATTAAYDVPSYSRSMDRPDLGRQMSSEAQDLSQSEYMNRLLAAHNRVDDLLRSRGLNSDDERKYLRAWEEIPIIREERFRRVRTPSNSSDSGLSTDNDSDRSNAEPPARASARNSPARATPPRSLRATPERSPPAEAIQKTEPTFHRHEEEVACVHVVPLRSNHQQISFKCHSATNETASVKLLLKSTKSKNQTAHFVGTLGGIMKIRMEFSCKSSNFSHDSCAQILHRRPAIASTRGVFQLRRCKQTVKASFKITPEGVPIKKSDDFHAITKLEKPNTKILTPAEHQKLVLASLKPTKSEIIPCTAEISIQHCSFYQVAGVTKEVRGMDKNVRMNLRLTERAPKNCAAVITLPAPPKVVYARLDVRLPEQKKPERARTGQVVAPARVVGKLTRSMTMDVTDEKKELRKVNRLRIPDYFLSQTADAFDEIRNARNSLKKIPMLDVIFGGFVVTGKPANPPLRRANAIRRKPAPSKIKEDLVNRLTINESNEPYQDFLPSSPGIPQIKVVDIPNPKPPPDPGSDPGTDENITMPTAGSLNLPGSLYRTATYSGAATLRESLIAELSDTDRKLVEQFRRSSSIPRPQFLKSAIFPFPFRRSRANDKDAIRREENIIQRAEFIRRRSPTRLQPKLERRCFSPPRLSRTEMTRKRFFSKRAQLLELPVTLRKVVLSDRKRPCHRNANWMPKWRKQGSDEEVVEEEEEEVEQEVEATTDNEERTGRVATKSYNEESGENLTEGEKAMAAAKRRHEEEDQFKLMDYEERRRIEREKEEEELRKLKEKQERRKLEREQEEKEMNDKRRAEDDKRKKEEEDRKAKIEEEKRRKDEEKSRRAQISGGAFPGTQGGGRNFAIPKKTDHKNEKFGNIVQAKQEMGMTKEQQEDAKTAFIASITKGIPVASDLLPADLKAKIKELHARICKLETEKYDLEKRHERQTYDLKELNERSRQVARNNALKKGLDPAEAGSSKHPPRVLLVSKFDRLTDRRSFSDRFNIFAEPKVQLSSKYDRQIDRRNFSERRKMFENRNAYPCFPGVLPPPALYEKVILKYASEKNEEDGDDVELDKPTTEPNIARGVARPPPEWGRKHLEEIEAYLNNPDRCPKYQEQKFPVSKEVSRPHFSPRPIQIPSIFN